MSPPLTTPPEAGRGGGGGGPGTPSDGIGGGGEGGADPDTPFALGVEAPDCTSFIAASTSTPSLLFHMSPVA